MSDEYLGIMFKAANYDHLVSEVDRLREVVAALHSDAEYVRRMESVLKPFAAASWRPVFGSPSISYADFMAAVDLAKEIHGNKENGDGKE